MTRNWRKLLADAEKRGLAPCDLAREEGVSSGTVHSAEQLHGIFLSGANHRGVTGRKNIDWTRVLMKARDAGEGFNAFCLRMAVTANSVKRAEDKTGIRLRRGESRELGARR